MIFERSYRISRATGDRYGAEWVREQFSRHGISYEAAERSKSSLYAELLPLLNSGRVELLDNPRLLAQLCSLERRTARGGRDSIDHPPGAHDDIANAVAGAVVELAVPRMSNRGIFELYRQQAAAIEKMRRDGEQDAAAPERHTRSGMMHSGEVMRW